MNAFPLLRAKSSTYEGRVVYTADAVEPCAWACGKCGNAYRGALGEVVAAACCSLAVVAMIGRRHTSKCNDGPGGCDPDCDIGDPEVES